ncbi:hypothetical protein P5673_008326, partial [Acropora cervicornis]
MDYLHITWDVVKDKPMKATNLKKATSPDNVSPRDLWQRHPQCGIEEFAYLPGSPSFSFTLGRLKSGNTEIPRARIEIGRSFNHWAALCWSLLPNSFKSSPRLGSFKKSIVENNNLLNSIISEKAS